MSPTLNSLFMSSGGVADKKSRYANGLKHAHGECDLLHVVALVVVETALHGNDSLSGEAAEDEVAGVSFDCRYRHIWNLRVGDILLVFDMVDESTETGAEYDGNARYVALHSRVGGMKLSL